jgi:hypothetical protein
MDHGIEIYLNQLSSIEIASDGQTATFGGGVMAKNVTDALWAVGKQTGKSKRSYISLVTAVITQVYEVTRS